MADITATIEADATPLKKTLSGVEKDVDTLANSITARLQRIGGAIAGIKSIYATAAGSIQKALSFTSQAAEVEKLTAGFEALTGSAASTRAVVKDIGDYSITTAYDPNQLLMAADKLMKAGIADSQVGEVTKNLAKIAGGKEDVLADLSKEVAKGYTSVEGFKVDFVSPFSEKGIDLKGSLEKVLNKQGDELKKEIEKGLDFSVVAKALQDLAADTGPLAQQTDKINNTLSGKVQQIQNAWGANMASIGAGINTSIGPILDGIGEKLRDILPAAQQLGEKIGHYLGEAIKIATDFGLVLVDVAQWFQGLSGEAKLFAIATVSSFVMIRTGAFSSITGIGGAWKGMCVMMATGFRAAMVAVKGALISTGIGVLIVGLGIAVEKLGLLDFGGDEEEGESPAAAASRERYKQIKESGEDKIAMYANDMQKLRGKDDLSMLQEKIRKEREDTTKAYDREGNEGGRKALAQYAVALQACERKINVEGAAIAQAAEAKKAAAAREAALAKEREEAEKKAIENEKAYAAARLEWARKLEDRELAKQSADSQTEIIAEKLLGLGVAPGPDMVDGITAKIDALSQVKGSGQTKEQLDATQKSIDELKRYRDKWVELSDRKKEIYKQESAHEDQMALKRAELTGDKKRVQLLKDQIELAEKIKTLTDAGIDYSKASKMAREEISLDRIQQRQDQRTAQLGSQPLLGPILAQSGVSIGNGGVSLGMAKTTLRETQKQTGILTEIRNIQQRWKPGEIVLSA